MINFIWFDHLLAIIFLILIPVASLRTGPIDDQEMELPPKKHLYYTNALTLCIAASMVISSWNIWKKPWSVLGVSWIEWNRVVAISVVALVIFYIADTIVGLRSNSTDEEEDLSQIVPSTWREYGHYVSLAVAAGLCEEIIYRGFLVPYLDLQLSGLQNSYMYAIAFPALAFGVSHLYQGWIAVVKIIIVAILLGVIFYYSKSLIIVVLLHVGIDLVSGAMGMVKPKDSSPI